MHGNVVIMPIFQLKELIKVKKLKLVVSFSFPFPLFFYVIMPKNWVGRTTLNEGKKGDRAYAE